MSRVVKEIPGRSRDWEKLFDGKVHLLKLGEDFTCKPYSMQCQAYAAALKLGYIITTRRKNDNVYIQATKRVPKEGSS